MLTSPSQRPADPPATPRQAAKRRAPIDRCCDVALFKALSDQTRAALLCCLIKCGRPCSVTELAECCAVNFSVVARHLALLARVELVHGRKRGRTVWYHANAAGLARQLRALADAIDRCGPNETCCGAPGADAACERRSPDVRGTK